MHVSIGQILRIVVAFIAFLQAAVEVLRDAEPVARG